MTMKLFVPVSLFVLLLASCQTVTPPPTPADLSTATQAVDLVATAAAQDNANQTATAEARKSLFSSALTADALTAAAVTPVPMFKVQVPANACWMNSDVTVTAGQKLTISASGSANTNGGVEGSTSGPNGQPYMCGGTKCPVIGVGYGSLIGRVEGGKAFFVGEKLEFVPDQDGVLSFTVNDWECDDNSGAFDLIITFQ